MAPPHGAVEAGVSHVGASRRGRWIPLVVGSSVLCIAAALSVAAVMLSPTGATTLLLLKPAQRAGAVTPQQNGAGKAQAAPGRRRDALGEDLQRDLKLARALSVKDRSVQHSALGSAMSAVEKRLQQDGKVAASLLELAQAGGAGDYSTAGDAGDYFQADADALLSSGKTTMLRRRVYAAAAGADRSHPPALPAHATGSGLWPMYHPD